MLACLAVTIFSGWTTVQLQNGEETVLEKIGLKWDRVMPSAVTAARLTAVLFAGPIAMKWPLEYPHEIDVQVIRNLLVAPICEEFVFRACMVQLLKENGTRAVQIVLLTPLFFGAAHLHHLYELIVFHKVSLTMGLVQVAFQFVYTCIFGWYATYLFLATGSIAGSVVAHQMCNYLGFPEFWAIASHPRKNLILFLLATGIPAFFYLLPQLDNS